MNSFGRFAKRWVMERSIQALTLTLETPRLKPRLAAHPFFDALGKEIFS
jgi:hypothetical protein